MKISNKWLCFHGIVLGVSFLMASVAFAQQEKQPPSAGEIAAKMKQNLNLTDEQVSQITPVIEENIQQRQAIMEQAKGQETDRDAMKGQMAALRESMESKLAQYLTPEQLEKWKTSIQQKHSGRRNHNRRGAPSGGESSDTGSTSGNGQ